MTSFALNSSVWCYFKDGLGKTKYSKSSSCDSKYLEYLCKNPIYEFDMGMQTAVNAKRFHHQWLPDEVVVEKGGIDSVIRTKLEKKGYKFRERKAIGRVDAILKTQWGYYEGGADPRGDDTKLGW